MGYLISPLRSIHKKEAFDCGNTVLNHYLHKQASQDMKKKLAVCFVMENTHHEVLGFYTLSNSSVPRGNLPIALRDKMPPAYHNFPATLLGRLAVDLSLQGKGEGEFLLMDALYKSYKTSVETIASLAVVVDPIDIKAHSFYKKYGFIELPDSQKMFLPMKTIAGLF